MFISAIIVAGGRGERMKSPVPKQFLDINGVSLISLSIIFFEKLEIVNEVIIVMLPEWIEHLENNILSKGSFEKVSKIVEGGKFRQDSFKNGLIHSKGEIVIDHDAVRPFPGFLDINNMVEKCEKLGAVVPIIPVKDTVKYLEDDRVQKTINRNNLFCVQTPQIFRKKLCLRAYKRAEEDEFYGSDTASLFENAKIPVYTYLGSVFNIKITTDDDLELARAINQYYFNHK
ncbi:2-C-methyl-D-erythritol 4-phosphate cytidylyltransferase [candidate division WOR-3 bacterium]|nr:2-C-methyl-D-erythritol 4-phosphate cytidylyltransferase [candidate division WOR-3 bacterium]